MEHSLLFGYLRFSRLCRYIHCLWLCSSYTPPDQLRVFTKTADILVVATGIPGLITADMVKPGVAVIDVGINRVYDEQLGKYKLVGDVDFEGELLDFIHGDL